MIGRLARDPELRFVAGNGKVVANFSIAVNRPFSKDKQADFFRVVVWGKTADNVEFLEWGDKNKSNQAPSNGFDSDGFQEIEDDDDIYPFRRLYDIRKGLESSRYARKIYH